MNFPRNRMHLGLNPVCAIHLIALQSPYSRVCTTRVFRHVGRIPKDADRAEANLVALD